VQAEQAAVLLLVTHFRQVVQIQYLAILHQMAAVLVVKDHPEMVRQVVLVAAEGLKVHWVLVVQQIRVQLAEQLVMETQELQQQFLIHQVAAVVLE
jgi:hypothetical protein